MAEAKKSPPRITEGVLEKASPQLRSWGAQLKAQEEAVEAALESAHSTYEREVGHINKSKERFFADLRTELKAAEKETETSKGEGSK